MELKRRPDSIEELAEDPAKYGMPTFEEFCRDKSKWLGRPDDELAAIDRGDPVLGVRQVYYIQTRSSGECRLESLEQFERIARDEGFDPFHDYYVDPQIRDDGFNGLHNHVTFRPKTLVEKRRHWA